MKSGTSRLEPITERGRGCGSSSLKYAVSPLRTPPASQSPREEEKLESQRVFFPLTRAAAERHLDLHLPGGYASKRRTDRHVEALPRKARPDAALEIGIGHLVDHRSLLSATSATANRITRAYGWFAARAPCAP